MYKSHHLHTNPVSVFVSIFNQGLHSRKETVLFPFHSTINDLIILFYNKQYISSYKYVTMPIYKKKKRVLLTYISVSFNWYQNNSPSINVLKSYFLPSRKLYVGYHRLMEMKKKHPHVHLHILISTAKGLLWLDECIEFKIGGHLLFEII